MKRGKIKTESFTSPPLPLPSSLLRLAAVLADIAKQSRASTPFKKKHEGDNIRPPESAVNVEEGDYRGS